MAILRNHLINTFNIQFFKNYSVMAIVDTTDPDISKIEVAYDLRRSPIQLSIDTTDKYVVTEDVPLPLGAGITYHFAAGDTIWLHGKRLVIGTGDIRGLNTAKMNYYDLKASPAVISWAGTNELEIFLANNEKVNVISGHTILP